MSIYSCDKQVRGAKVLSMNEEEARALQRWNQEATSLGERLSLLGDCMGMGMS